LKSGPGDGNCPMSPNLESTFDGTGARRPAVRVAKLACNYGPLGMHLGATRQPAYGTPMDEGA
jgi:hypothetical protein